MWHLLWKDTKAIQSLWIVIALGIVLFNLQLWWMSYSRSTAQLYSLLWILMPNLFAFGAPAMLVSSEEESGTLDWMRTLPVSWQKIARSKIVVAVAGLILCWVVATVMLLLANPAFLQDDPRYLGVVKSLFHGESIGYYGCYNFALLLCGFITAYTLRSPIAALLAVIPLAFGLVSRRNGVLLEWKRYQQTPWSNNRPGSLASKKMFMMKTVEITASNLFFERTRTDRYVDQTTKWLLDCSTGLQEERNEAFDVYRQLWRELGLAREYPYWPHSWDFHQEETIDRLKKQYAKIIIADSDTEKVQDRVDQEASR